MNTIDKHLVGSLTTVIPAVIWKWYGAMPQNGSRGEIGRHAGL